MKKNNSYHVYNRGILVDIYYNREDAEKAIAEMLAKYDWMKAESLYIKEY